MALAAFAKYPRERGSLAHCSRKYKLMGREIQMKYHRLKYRLCMQHSFDGNIGQKHRHMMEIEIVARHTAGDFLEFASMESILEEVYGPYQHQYLNDFPEFSGDTSMEHLGQVFYLKGKASLEKQHWKLARFEISETPLRVYAIAEEIF